MSRGTTWRWLSAYLFSSLVLSACGGAPHGETASEISAIEALRHEAAAHPSDPALQRRLAEWELLGDDGDVARAEAAIAHAAELAPDDVSIAYLRAVLAEQHGQADPALDAFLEVIAGATTSDDPLAPFYAESSLAYLHELRINAPRFEERTLPVLERVFATPGHVGLPVRHEVRLWLQELAMERGDEAAVTRLDAALGSPTTARVAGPFGPHVLAPFDQTLAAEGAGPLAERYDLGPGRGLVATRTITADHGSFDLAVEGPPETRGPGTRVVESTLHVSDAGRHVLSLATSGSLQVSVDGEVVARIDRRTHWYASAVYVPLDLAAGDHELELKIASRVATPTAVWILDRAEGGYSPEAGLTLPADPEGPLALYVTADVMSDRGDTVGARELLRGHVDDRSSATLLSLAARIASVDPYVQETRRSDDERRLVAWAAARDADAYWPAFRVASLETGDLESIAARRSVAARFSHMASMQLSLAQSLGSAGYVADADAALERAASLRPDACAVVQARFASLAMRGRIDQAETLLDGLMACDAAGSARLDVLANHHDWAGARAELERLSHLVSPERQRALALRIARASGDATEETRLIAAAEERAQPGETVLREADRHYAAGERAEALRVIQAEEERAPRYASDLRSLSFALSGHDVMDAFRVDGLDVVRRFEASGRNYDGHAAVLVFDYMVTRVFADGSALDLVHQIYRVQTAEGVEQYGSLHLGGRVLTVRAIGPGGVVREPDHVASDTDMPPLEIGDYVEYEVVREHAPSWGDAYESEGWVFQNFSEPFDHSEMVFVAPVDMPLTFDVRGPVPPPVVREENGLRVSRFVIEQSQPLVQEPNWVADPPVLPSLRAVARVTWDRMYGAVYDGLLGLDAVDPAAERLLREEVLGDATSPREQAQRIHRWVMDNVEPTENAFYLPAPRMVSARRGNRLRVLRYLLELAGIPARFVYARELAGDRPVEGAPDADVYGSSLVQATLPEGPLYLASIARGVAHDFLPPGLRGQDAIVIEPTLGHVTLPAHQGTPSRQRIDGTVAIDEHGVGHVTLTLAFDGGAAAELRTGIEQIAPAERAAVLAERFVPSVVPGASADPSSIAIEGLDDWEQGLSIRFDAESAGLLHPARDGYHLVPLFPSGLEGAFARLESRTTTELVGEVDIAVSLTVTGPGRVRAPEPADLAGPLGAHATLEVGHGQDATVTLRRHVVLPIGLVPVAAYPSFAQFCRATSQIDQRSVVIQP